MRKSLVIIATVAALGVIAAYLAPSKTSQKSTATVVASTPTTVQQEPAAASTIATTPTTTASTTQKSGYKDGKFTGQTDTNDYEDIQVSVTISAGKITDAKVSSSASEGRSREIVDFAASQLVDETKSSQSSNIDSISGATSTSSSYIRSLQSALDQARQG